MPKRYDVYRGGSKVGEIWERPDWEGEIVQFVLSWVFYLAAMPFVLAFTAIRERSHRS